MAVDAMLSVRTINLRGDIKYPVKAVNVLKAHGRSARESLFVSGYALNCTVASQGMHSHMVQPSQVYSKSRSHEEAGHERQDRLSRHQSVKDSHAARGPNFGRGS